MVKPKRVFHVDPVSFLPFNDSPRYLSGEVTRDLDTVTIRGVSSSHLQGWHSIGGRTEELDAHSFAFSVSVLPTEPLGACSVGIKDIRGMPSINVSHFIRSSGSLHKPTFAPNFYSGFGFDDSNRRTQTGIDASWQPLNRHHNFSVEYRHDAGLLTCFANGMQVHQVAGKLGRFQLEILAQAVAVEGAFCFHFERLHYLSYDDQGEQNCIRLNAWDQSYPPVFVSYAHEDKSSVDKLVARLKREWVRVLGDWDLNIGDSLLTRLSGFISTAGCVLVMLSPASVSSSWVKQELEQAINEKLEGQPKRMLPVLIEDCEIPRFLRGQLYADYRSRDESEFRKILQAIRNLGMW